MASDQLLVAVLGHPESSQTGEADTSVCVQHHGAVTLRIENRPQVLMAFAKSPVDVALMQRDLERCVQVTWIERLNDVAVRLDQLGSFQGVDVAVGCEEDNRYVARLADPPNCSHCPAAPEANCSKSPVPTTPVFTVRE